MIRVASACASRSDAMVTASKASASAPPFAGGRVGGRLGRSLTDRVPSLRDCPHRPSQCRTTGARTDDTAMQACWVEAQPNLTHGRPGSTCCSRGKCSTVHAVRLPAIQALFGTLWQAVTAGIDELGAGELFRRTKLYLLEHTV
jgi:hypothetical protein